MRRKTTRRARPASWLSKHDWRMRASNTMCVPSTRRPRRSEPDARRGPPALQPPANPDDKTKNGKSPAESITAVVAAEATRRNPSQGLKRQEPRRDHRRGFLQTAPASELAWA